MGVMTRIKSAVGLYTGADPASAGYSMVARVTAPGGMPPEAGTYELLRSYSRQPWLRAVAGKVAFSTAAVSWKLYAVTKGGKAQAAPAKRIQRAMDPRERRALLKEVADEKQLVEITQHPFLDLFNRPNGFLSGNALRRLTQLHLDLVGESFWLKERDRAGNIVGLWPLPPYWIRQTPTPARQSYFVSFRGWQGEVPETEIFWQSDPNPEFPYGRGRGVAQSLTDELEIDYYGGKYLKSWFYNGARPEIIVTGKGLNPADTARLEETWAAKQQGFLNAYKVLFLNSEVDIKTVDTNFRNMQLVQLREAERNIIVQVWGIPPELLGILEHSNRATIVVAKELMSEGVLMPRLEFQRDNMQQRLMPEWDERLILDYVSPFGEDKEFNLQVMSAQPAAFRIDEWRAIGGQGPLPDGQGNTFLIPSLTVPTDPAQLPTETPEAPDTVPVGTVSEAHRPKALPAPKSSAWPRL